MASIATRRLQMTDQPNPNAGTGAGGDETFTWTDETAGSAGATAGTGGTGATGDTGSTGSTGWTGGDPGENAGPTGGGWGASSGTGQEPGGGTAGAAAVQVLEQLRDAIDDLAERASPTVREYSARIAELAAFTADKTAPFLKRAGEATAEASGKLAERSRSWAADIRASQGTGGASGAGGTPGSTTGDASTGTNTPWQPSTPPGTGDQQPASGDVTVSESDAVAPDEGGGGIA
jgi:hypothetical protein